MGGALRNAGHSCPEGFVGAATTKWWVSVQQTLCCPSLPTTHLLSVCSPHPVKPLSAAPAEGSPDRKQPRSSLSTALSSGLEKLKTVTSGSVQPVAPASQAGQTVDPKRLKVRSSRMPGGHQTRHVVLWREVRNRVLGRPAPHTRALRPVRRV